MNLDHMRLLEENVKFDREFVKVTQELIVEKLDAEDLLLFFATNECELEEDAGALLYRYVEERGLTLTDGHQSKIRCNWKGDGK